MNNSHAPQASTPKAAQSSAPPMLELDGKKWNVENIHGNSNVVIETSGTNQSVYIYRCNNSTFSVKVICFSKYLSIIQALNFGCLNLVI